MINPRLPALLQGKTADLALASAQVHAVGGPEWIVTRTSGNGVDENVSKAYHLVNPLYIYLFRPERIERNGEWFQPDDEWRYTAPAGTNVLPLDQVQSTADATRQFQIMTRDTPVGYIAGTAEVSIS